MSAPTPSRAAAQAAAAGDLRCYVWATRLADARAASPEPEERAPLDPELREHLRVLGYLAP